MDDEPYDNTVGENHPNAPTTITEPQEQLFQLHKRNAIRALRRLRMQNAVFQNKITLKLFLLFALLFCFLLM